MLELLRRGGGVQRRLRRGGANVLARSAISNAAAGQIRAETRFSCTNSAVDGKRVRFVEAEMLVSLNASSLRAEPKKAPGVLVSAHVPVEAPHASIQSLGQATAHAGPPYGRRGWA